MVGQRALLEVLSEARERGFLGPGPVEDHIPPALAFSAWIGDAPGTALDLGSGGGLPGLPLAMATPATRWYLLDGSQTRADFLSAAVARLGLADRVEVIPQRAEDAGRGRLRHTIDVVVARSFAAPAVTAECAAPFLRVGGRLVVAEPPGGRPERWLPAGLDRLGLTAVRNVSEPYAFQLLEQVRPCPDAFPRRVGIPAKRPVF